MERLTAINHGICQMVSAEYCLTHKDCYTCGHGRKVFKSLSAYGDTNLTPSDIADLKAKLQEAIECINYFASSMTVDEKCSRCIYNPNDMGCELDGSQFDDDGECHFTWCRKGTDEK